MAHGMATAVRFSALALAATAPQAAAAPSILTGTEDGVLRGARRCLSSSRQPVLHPGGDSVQRVMLEESSWHSHYIVTAIAATILKEHLGYDVIFNAPASPGRTFERTAFADSTTAARLDDGDGAQLLALQAGGRAAFYMNMEVWGSEWRKQASSRKYEKNVEKRAGLGYDGREGWYMPFWVTEACNSLAYPAFKVKAHFAAVESAFEMVGKIVRCPGAGYFTNPNIWCPHAGRMIALETAKEYALHVEQEIILNNGFNIAMVLREPVDLESTIRSAVNGSDPGPFQACGKRGAIRPFLSYHWEPTVLSARIELERLLLPTRNCGRLGGGSGTWKCDFPHQPLLKIASRSVARRAPLLDDFLAHFTVPDINDLLLNFSNRSAVGAAPVSDHYWAIACDWVKQNEDLWITWTATRQDLPGWSMVLDPVNFFFIFFSVFLGLLALCFLSESLFVTGQSARKRGNAFGWTGEWEVGLPLVPWLLGFTGKVFSGSEVAPKDPSRSATPPGCPLLWAASAFYGRMSDGAVEVCLLRFGDEAQLAEALTVHISTEDGTMKAGAAGHAPGYKPLDHAELRFEPNRCAAWTSVKLLDTGFWGPELRFRVVVDGGLARGSRSCTCVVRDCERRWPGQSLHEPNGFSVRKNLGLVRELLVLVARFHGWRQETKRVLYCVVDSLYDTVGANYLWTVYVIDTCIQEGHREGLFYAAIVHGIALCFKRCKEWHFTAVGTSGISLMLKRLSTTKAFDSGMDASHHEASASALFHLHTQLVDESLPVFYNALYGVLDGAVTLIAAPIFIIVMGTTHPIPLSELARLTLFLLVPFFVMIGTLAYTSVLRKVRARDQLLEAMTESQCVYMANLDQAIEMRPLISQYGPESAYDPSARLHVRGSMHSMRPRMRNIYYRKDTIFILDAVGTCVYAAALVAMALLHIESKEFGSCQFDFSYLLMSLMTLSKVKTSFLGISEHWQKVYESFHLAVHLGKFLNFKCTDTERLAARREMQLQRLPLGASVPSGAFMEQIMRPLSMEVSGRGVPLGRAYMLGGQTCSIQDFCLGLASPSNGTAVELPAFVHVLRLVPGLPLHFDANDEGMLLASELLAFAEPGRFSASFAESLRSAISPLLLVRLVHETSGRGPDLELLKVRAQQLTQALLADPEVLVLDSFLQGLPLEHSGDMLRAVLKWQLGGPQAILGPAPPARRAQDAGAPEWLCHGGGVRRTLLLHLWPETETYHEVMLEHLPRINVDDSAPKVVEPDPPEAGSANEHGASVDEKESLAPLDAHCSL